MDIDVKTISVQALKDIVIGILTARSFHDILRSFNIQRVIAPDMAKAKQTQTTQRFKIHLVTAAGEDLFTKIEFSRRGMNATPRVESISAEILRAYKFTPVLVSHYDIFSAITQKVNALAGRSTPQARDVFDLYILYSQYEPPDGVFLPVTARLCSEAEEKLFSMGSEQFRDTVVSFLSSQDRDVYARPEAWDDIRLKVAQFLSEIKEARR
jgi:hypothetical protein